MRYPSVMQDQVQGRGDLLEQELGIHTYFFTLTTVAAAPQSLERRVR